MVSVRITAELKGGGGVHGGWFGEVDVDGRTWHRLLDIV